MGLAAHHRRGVAKRLRRWMAGWRASPGRSAVCCVPEPKGTAAARSSVPARNVVAMVPGTATPRRAPGAATANANLSVPPADAQRRRDWSGTVGRGSRTRSSPRCSTPATTWPNGAAKTPAKCALGLLAPVPGGNDSERSTVAVRVPASLS